MAPKQATIIFWTATILWLAASLGFKFYIASFGNYTETYGAIGGIMILMLWFYISGLMILNDTETGFPLSVMDATWITAMRTGAATAVAAKYLARPESSSLAILGCGVQGRSNLEAMGVVMAGLQQVFAFDILPEIAHRFSAECESRYALSCQVCASPEEAVRSAELVVTAGPILRNPTPMIEVDWLQYGSFLCALDFDSYVTPRAFRSVEVVCTIEDHVLHNGFGCAVIEHLNDAGIATPVVRIGWPDQFIEHGAVDIMRRKHGLTAAAAVDKILTRLIGKATATAQPKSAA